MSTIQTILHPTDFSTLSGGAFKQAYSLARDHKAKLVLLHVIEPKVVIYSGTMMPPPPPRAPEEEREALREQLRQMKLPDNAVTVEHRVVEGDPATAILHIAKDIKADLIVLGTHGRTGLGRLLMGSVAEKVVRNAECPVLTVKVPITESAST